MKDDFPYENLHDYLDEVFLDKIPSKEEVQKEKRQYRRMYNTALKRYIRKRKVHLTLSLEQAEHRKLEKQARMFGISLYDYIRNSALKAKSPQSTKVPKEQVFCSKTCCSDAFRNVTELANEKFHTWPYIAELASYMTFIRKYFRIL